MKEIEPLSLKKKSLSTLSLIIMSDDTSSKIRALAENEMKERLRNTDTEISDILRYDKEALEVRGTNPSNYLITNPDMNLLMNLFFDHYVYDVSEYPLLLSELNLCNRCDYPFNFMKKLLTFELKNIDSRLDDDYEEQIEELMLARQFLLDRINDNSKQNLLQFNLKNRISINRCRRYYLTEHEDERSKIALIDKADMYLSRKLESSKKFQQMFDLRMAKRDFNTLRDEREMLLEDARDGYYVDYKPIVRKLSK